jgi:hypothetical protein
MTGNAVDERIVEGIGGKLGVGRQQAEDGGFLEDQFGIVLGARITG